MSRPASLLIGLFAVFGGIITSLVFLGGGPGEARVYQYYSTENTIQQYYPRYGVLVDADRSALLWFPLSWVLGLLGSFWPSAWTRSGGVLLIAAGSVGMLGYLYLVAAQSLFVTGTAALLYFAEAILGSWWELSLYLAGFASIKGY